MYRREFNIWSLFGTLLSVLFILTLTSIADLGVSTLIGRCLHMLFSINYNIVGVVIFATLQLIHFLIIIITLIKCREVGE